MSCAAILSGCPRVATLVLLGDIMLGRYVGWQLEVGGPLAHRQVWGDTLALVRGLESAGDASVAVAGNLETAITTHDVKWPNKTFNYKAPPGAVGALTAAGVEFVSLANNHSLDFMAEGLRETIGVLDAAGVLHAGAGMDAASASAPAAVDVGGCRVAFLSYADHYEEWAAGPARPGIHFIDPTAFDRLKVEEELRHARTACDANAVVVFIHWGPNYRWRPSEDLIKLGHAFIDAGAACVFGHSAHHIQGVEVYRGRPIVFSARSAIDDYAVDAQYRNDIGAFHVLDFQASDRAARGTPDGPTPAPGAGGGVAWGPVRLRMVPVHITHVWGDDGGGAGPPYLSRVEVASGEALRFAESHFRRLCEELGARALRGSVEAGGRAWPCFDVPLR